ncbi:MAG: nucleotidyltransferase family protein [Rhizomicrobium sp.]
MTDSEFLAAILSNPTNRTILATLPALDLPDAWLVSGALFQTVWNELTNRPADHGIRDYDIFYFDPDDSWAAEDDVIRRVRAAFGGVAADIEIRNQARVHLWYAQKFGAPYPPLARATDGIDRFLMHNAQVGIRARGDTYEIYAPRGFHDLANLIVRPNPTANFRADLYYAKAERWKASWPEITIVPA